MSTTTPQLSTAGYAARINFLVDLGECLHMYGTTAQRLEGALVLVADKLGLECEPWSTPTGLILSFSDPGLPPGESGTTRVIRMPPGDNDLQRLCETDRIVEDVLASRIGLAEGHAALRALNVPRSRRWWAMQVLAYGLVAAAVAGLLRLPWLEIAVVGGTGLVTGLLAQLSEARPRLREASEAVAAMSATAVAIIVASFIAPLNQNTVIISSLIVLLPGLSLTNAMNELTSQHWSSGSVRLAGAVTIVMKLAVGTAIALYIGDLAGLQPAVRALRPQPDWVEWVALLSGSLAFAVLFRAARRDYLKVMVAAASGYLISRYVGLAWGSGAGIFMSALVITAAGNAYARWWHRPGAIIRVPGIVLLVPGSASLRGLLNLIQQQDVTAGQVAMLAVLNILLALVAGLLFGNMLLPSRRNL